MTKKRISNLPENVLPQNQFFDSHSNVTNLHNSDLAWSPLHIETDYMSPKELKRQEKLMARHNRKDSKRNRNKNGNIGGKKTSRYNEEFMQESTRVVKVNTTLDPRSERQKEYLTMLEDHHTHMVFGVGPAGSGKTYMATKWAALALQEDIFDKIIITRPTVSVSENIGFLPGTLEEKMDPWILPVKDVLEEVFGKSKVESFFRLGKISIEPLGFMRGRTFKNSVILLDEAQNCTPDQLKMFLTRIGEGSKIIVTGDIKQSDYNNTKNGLLDFLIRIKKIDGVDVIKFDKSDIQRHHLIGEILKLYGEED